MEVLKNEVSLEEKIVPLKEIDIILVICLNILLRELSEDISIKNLILCSPGKEKYNMILLK